ncbi:MAG: efflux RND transporter periplasmic adaptor subunit [Rikenellaceae bacterium]|nr:efflux RND transporter periplasmic adaptor subunit [Rikenellaceae bacterium]MBR3800993.1 efflux RND transporter periplasmic adaptor subunit [Rikenellaceae bacterium]
MVNKTLVIALLAVAFSGCRGRIPNALPERRVKVQTVERLDFIDKDFAGMSTADNSTNLAFKVGGLVERIDISEGRLIPAGYIIAQLDPKEFELRRNAARSAFETARAQYERAQRLLERQAISRAEYEVAQTQFVQAQADYENATDVLTETKLRAPFEGIIERQFVDTYQRVNAGQSIVRLVDPRTRSVRFTMPESGLNLLSDTSIRFSVEFDNYRGVQFPAYLKEYVQTSSDASGFPVSLGLREPLPAGRFDITPGMSCTVTMQVDQSPASDEVSVPLSAIYAPTGGGTYVWVVRDGAVHLQPITLGEIFGRNRVVVERGLEGGEQVVTAGVYRLQEGERVVVIQ